MNQISYCKYCKLPKHQCQCTSGEWSTDFKPVAGTIKTQPEEIGFCPRCNKCWNIHDCPEVGDSGNIYKHLVYNPHMRNIQQVIQEAGDEENLNSGLGWQFVRVQPVTEYEWVAIFMKWVS